VRLRRPDKKPVRVLLSTDKGTSCRAGRPRSADDGQLSQICRCQLYDGGDSMHCARRQPTKDKVKMRHPGGLNPRRAKRTADQVGATNKTGWRTRTADLDGARRPDTPRRTFICVGAQPALDLAASAIPTAGSPRWHVVKDDVVKKIQQGRQGQALGAAIKIVRGSSP